MSISIHALREEGDIISAKKAGIWTKFLSTPSARRATPVVPVQNVVERVISIHALREEGDALRTFSSCAAGLFLSTPSARRATLLRPIVEPDQTKFLSTPSARRATQFSAGKAIRCTAISIHALREEGDDRCGDVLGGRIIFLSTPSARRATHNTPKQEDKTIFLSTPSARRATKRIKKKQKSVLDFYPRPPRGGRPHDVAFVGQRNFISIHALREEGDPITKPCSSKLFVFLSTPSARRATAHSLRCRKDSEDFYPRPPRGGRPGKSTVYEIDGRISIHALREEGDIWASRQR